MKNKFFILWIAGIVSTIALLPYIFDLQHDIISKAPVSPLIVGLTAVAQTALLLAITIFFGLRLSQGLGFSVLESSESELKKKLVDILHIAIPLGIITAMAIKLGDIFFTPYIPKIVEVASHIPLWKTLLVPLYGGIVEEILMRLFVLSFIVWLLTKITGTKEVIKNNTIIWIAIISASILFGLGHLPATATIMPLTTIVVIRAILLNGIGGVVFGWLYWKKGLEYAIVAHFITDLVLLSVLPMIFR